MNDLLFEVVEGVAFVTFNRPQSRNAITWEMYEETLRLCKLVEQSNEIKAVVFRGAGGQAFVAGTDIEQFLSFKSGADGLSYEEKIESYISAISSIGVPTIAAIDGWTIGGGLAIAAACDFRLATPQSKFGVPIAKTLGNCLSLSNLSRLSHAFGLERLKRMLLLAEVIDASEALNCGFLYAMPEKSELDHSLQALIHRLRTLAPVTLKVSKLGMNHLARVQDNAYDQWIELAYASEDFAEGVAAFVAKRQPVWKGH